MTRHLFPGAFPVLILVTGGLRRPSRSVRTRCGPSKNAELHLHRSLLQLRLKPAHQPPADQGSRRGEKAQKANDVGQNARRDEQRGRHENNHAVRQLFPRKFADAKTLIHAAPRREPFPAGQKASHNARDHDEGQGRPKSDERVDLDQQSQLDYGGEEKKYEETSKHGGETVDGQ